MKHKLEQQNVKEVFLKNIYPFYRFSIFMLPRASVYTSITLPLHSTYVPIFIFARKISHY